MQWQLKEFYELSLDELYEILRMRSEVFVVEQTCAYQDNDNKDQASLHLMCRSEETQNVIAYARLLPPGISYAGFTSIGRVVTASSHRGLGLGREVMRRSLEELATRYTNVPVRIGAQLYLQKFYEGFGFVVSGGEPYLEDGIYHIEMTRNAT